MHHHVWYETVHNFIVADGQDKIFTERIEEAERNFVMVAGTEQRVSLHAVSYTHLRA